VETVAGNDDDRRRDCRRAAYRHSDCARIHTLTVEPTCGSNTDTCAGQTGAVVPIRCGTACASAIETNVRNPSGIDSAGPAVSTGQISGTVGSAAAAAIIAGHHFGGGPTSSNSSRHSAPPDGERRAEHDTFHHAVPGLSASVIGVGVGRAT